jgi:hypothetical protein
MLANQISVLSNQFANPLLLMETEDKLIGDKVYEIQKSAIHNLWLLLKSYPPETTLHKYAYEKLLLLSKSPFSKIRSLFASTYCDDKPIEPFISIMISLASDPNNSVRHSVCMQLMKIQNGSAEVANTIQLLSNDKSKLVKSLFQSSVNETVVNEKALVSSLGKQDLENIIKQESDIENSIKSAAVEAKASNKNIDQLDPVDH